MVIFYGRTNRLDTLSGRGAVDPLSLHSTVDLSNKRGEPVTSRVAAAA